MEAKKKPPLLCLLLLAAFQLCPVRADDCQSQQDKNLTCYTDFDRFITCVWNGTNDPDRPDSACTLSGKQIPPKRRFRIQQDSTNASCVMKPVTASGAKTQKCTMDFKKKGYFQTFHEMCISLSCNPGKQILKMFYKPVDHIKLSPPGKPHVNSTTVSWFTQEEEHGRLEMFESQLQWKRWDQTWNEASRQTKTKRCKENCESQLDPDLLIKGETYEARARVKIEERWANSVWSDWSPSASWVSSVGTVEAATPTLLTDLVRGIMGMIITGAVLALFLGGVLVRNNNWVYKKVRGLPLPDPNKSFLKDTNFKNWLSPHFTVEALHSSSKIEASVPEEIMSIVDSVKVCSKEASLSDKVRSESSYESTSSSFSNPNYSHLCPPDAVSTPISWNSQACGDEAQSGTAGSQDECKSTKKDEEEERVRELQILQLLSNGSQCSVPVQVVSDYEKAEKIQMERLRLQSLDLGMCSGEEVSQESLESDSINAADGHKEVDDEVKLGENEKENVFQKLFGAGVASVFGKASIQVCSDYEQVHKLLPGSPELPSEDSGVSSGGEEPASPEESPEQGDVSNESTKFLFPPPPPGILSSLVPSFQQLVLKTDLTLTQGPPSPLSHTVERTVLMMVEPCGDGYRPARQK